MNVICFNAASGPYNLQMTLESWIKCAFLQTMPGEWCECAHDGLHVVGENDTARCEHAMEKGGISQCTEGALKKPPLLLLNGKRYYVS